MYLSLSVYTYIYIYICPVVQADRRDRHGAAEEAPGARGGLSSTSIHIPSHILWYGNGSSSVTCTLTIYFMVYYGELTMVHCNTPGDRGGLSSSSSMVIVIVQW